MNKLLFPTTIVEDFYQDPDQIRSFALSLPYRETIGYWPGFKSNRLDQVDPTLNGEMCKKFLSVYYDFLNPLEYTIRTEFELSYPHSDDKPNPINRGWIHQDYNSVLAGVVYLTPDAAPDSGTNFYVPKDDLPHGWYEELRQEASARFDAFKTYGEEYDKEDYNNKFYNTINKFKQVLSVDNIYNRLIIFDSHQWHGYNNLVCGDKPRLTQLFFVDAIGNCPSLPPYERIRNIKL